MRLQKTTWLTCIVFSFISPLPVKADDAGKLRHMVATADAAILKLGYDISTLDATYDDENQWWNDYYNYYSDKTKLDTSRLEGKNFLAVYYSPRNNMPGEALWVFVDRENNDVIHVIRVQ